jgi:hypothetical protein
MAQAGHEPKATLRSTEIFADTGSFMTPRSDGDGSSTHDHKHLRRARQSLSLVAFTESLVDLIVAICCAYFIAFAALVYSRRNQPVSASGNEELLDAAKYVSITSRAFLSSMANGYRTQPSSPSFLQVSLPSFSKQLRQSSSNTGRPSCRSNISSKAVPC